MGARNAIAIDLGRRRFRALAATRGKGAIRVLQTLLEEYPSDLNLDDAQAVGTWIGSRLRATRFPRYATAIALGREHVGLKRMSLPTTEDAELPDMTRLAMQRELPFDAETAVIDFVPVERSSAATTVLAVAVPQQVIEYSRAVAQAAGLSVERISLRTMGAAALLNTLANGERAPGPASGIAVDVTGEGVEFCVVSGGTIRFSRAAEVPQPQDQLAIADAVVTETRRTWMSYRIAEDSSDVASAIIMGDQRVCDYASGPVGEMLKIPVQVLKSHPRVNGGKGDLDHHWSLAGLLLEPTLGGELIDFARPRRAPDVEAKKRMRRLAAAGIAIIALLGAWTLGKRDLDGLRLRAATTTKLQEELQPSYARYWRDVYKRDHLRAWESVEVDWLQHATYLATIAPPPEQVVLDAWTGSLAFRGVAYDEKTNAWSAGHDLTIIIDGEARDRVTADAFRAALTQTPIYTASTTGADARGGKRMPFGFTYRLETKVGTPKSEPAPTAPNTQPAEVSQPKPPVSAALDGQSSSDAGAPSQ